MVGATTVGPYHRGTLGVPEGSHRFALFFLRGEGSPGKGIKWPWPKITCSQFVRHHGGCWVEVIVNNSRIHSIHLFFRPRNSGATSCKHAGNERLLLLGLTCAGCAGANVIVELQL